MSSESLFDKERLEQLLEEFLKELNNRGVKGTIFLVGGAALSLYYFERDSTKDIDAGLPSDPRILEVIKEISIREKLPSNWINSDASMYFGFPPADYWVIKRNVGEITLKAASPELLLAMKLKASRGRRDNEDILELMRIIGPKDISDILSIFENVYAQDSLDDDVIELVRNILEEYLR